MHASYVVKSYRAATAWILATCTVGIGDYRQLALGKQQYRYRHIDYIERLGRLNKSCIGIGIAD